MAKRPARRKAPKAKAPKAKAPKAKAAKPQGDALWARLASRRDDGDFCDAVFCAFAERDNEIDVEAMDEHERVVTLVWHAYGLIGNGGFEYLLGADVRGDPGFVYTAAAFKTIGAGTAYRCCQEALGCFPRSVPQDDLEERRAHYDAVPQATRDRIDRAFWSAKDEIESSLAAWIRAHRPQLEASLRR